MSREQKIYETQPARIPPPLKLPEEVTAQEKEDVTSLLAKGESGPALEQAKRIHKRCRTATSEALLLEAYLSRIPALAERGLENEAKSLMQLVRERYPAYRERLRSVAALFTSNGDGINDLLQPLNDQQLSPERRATILKAIRCRISDLGVIADCRVLPSDHSLRVGASALVKALEAVTSRLVADAELALPEISRQSPLAPWKMLARAIAAFYRREDSLCEKCLAAIEPDSIAARLVPALRTLVGQQQALTPPAIALVTQAGGTLDALRSTLEKLDKLLDRQDQSECIRQIRNAVAECEKSCPELLQRLKQHISIRGMRAGLKQDRVSQALGGCGALKNAYFWKLLARAFEQSKSGPDVILHTCGVWEEFRRHALREKWFPAKGPEIAALYLHMADLLLRIHPNSEFGARNMFAARSDRFSCYYEGQPPEIRAVMLPAGPPDLYMIYPDKVFARACEADPCSENFQRWFDWTRREQPGASDHTAQRWLAFLPSDVKPMLHLMASAEERGAFQKAYDYMEQAEVVDGLNPEVRKARFRLLMARATRHLQKRKTKLAWPELNALAILPQTQQGDRSAYVAALNFVGCMILGREEEANKERAKMLAVLNSDVAVRMVLRGAARACRFKINFPEPVPSGEEPLAAVGRACALGEDVGVPFDIPIEWQAQLQIELSTNGAAMDAGALCALGESALRTHYRALAYAASTIGLAGSPADHARFLFLRARALPDWLSERQNACVDAAAELARRQRDSELLDRISLWREEAFGPSNPVSADAMSTEEIDRILQLEKSESAFPAPPPKSDFSTRQDKSEPCDCPVCRGELPPVPEEIAELFDKYGPEEVARSLAGIFTGRGGRGRRKQKPYEI